MVRFLYSLRYKNAQEVGKIKPLFDQFINTYRAPQGRLSLFFVEKWGKIITIEKGVVESPYLSDTYRLL